MHNIPTRDAQPTVQRSTASCASDRRNPNESQELRSRKPRKAYRKQRQSLGAQNQNRAPSSFSSTHPVADATIGQDESPVNEQLLTERQVKRLASKIAARCMSLNVTLSEKGMDTLRNELAEAPIFDDDIWLYAAGEIIDTLSKADNDGFAFKQAGTKVPAMIVPAVVGDGSGTETVVDRYRWHRELPATMARQRAEMQSQVASDMAAIQEENDARDEYEAWVAERGLDDGFEPTNPSIYRRYVLRESLRAGYEVDRAAAQKRLDELRAARQTEQQVTQTVGAQ